MMSPADKMRGCGCNICRNLKVLKGYNDLESQKSEVMLDWNWKKNNQEGIYPDEIVYGSNKNKEACKYMMSNPSGKKMHYELINII